MATEQLPVITDPENVLSELTLMFPNLSKETVSTVLASNSGSASEAIDELLAVTVAKSRRSLAQFSGMFSGAPSSTPEPEEETETAKFEVLLTSTACKPQQESPGLDQPKVIPNEDGENAAITICGVLPEGLSTPANTTRNQKVACQLTPRTVYTKMLESKVEEMENKLFCGICLEAVRNIAFLCGHGACSECSSALKSCHICRSVIRKKINLYVD